MSSWLVDKGLDTALAVLGEPPVHSIGLARFVQAMHCYLASRLSLGYFE